MLFVLLNHFNGILRTATRFRGHEVDSMVISKEIPRDAGLDWEELIMRPRMLESGLYGIHRLGRLN